METQSGRVAVVGGGLAGLSAAWRLHRQGVRVVVWEAEEWVGGRTRTDRIDGYAVDSGAQLFGSMYSEFVGLAREVGLAGRLVRSSGRDALWRDGRAYEVVYGSVTSMLASGGLSWRTKMRLGTSYVPFLQRHADALDLHAPELAAGAGLDRESIADWGRRQMDEDFIDHLVYPQLAAYYGALPEETSSGLYHILAHHGVEVSVHALTGGAGSLCERIAERLRAEGSEVRLGRPVDRVELGETDVRVAAGTVEETFAGAVMAAPAPVARRLLGGAPEALDRWLASVRYRPTVTLGLLLDRPLGVRYFGLSFARSASRAVVAACVEENKVPGLAPEGAGLLVAFARPDVGPEMVERDPRQILDAMLPDLERAFPGVGARVTRARVYRWRTGNPVFYPGYLQRLSEFRRGGLEGPGPVALAGDYLYASSVEGAVTAGLQAAGRLLRRIDPARDV